MMGPQGGARFAWYLIYCPWEQGRLPFIALPMIAQIHQPYYYYYYSRIEQ